VAREVLTPIKKEENTKNRTMIISEIITTRGTCSALSIDTSLIYSSVERVTN